VCLSVDLSRCTYFVAYYLKGVFLRVYRTFLNIRFMVHVPESEKGRLKKE